MACSSLICCDISHTPAGLHRTTVCRPSLPGLADATLKARLKGKRKDAGWDDAFPTARFPSAAALREVFR